MRFRPIILAVALSLGAGAAFADRDESGKGRDKWEKHEKKRLKEERKEEKRLEKERKREAKLAGDSYFHRHGYERLSIPKGHYPPPGMCRAWYPGRPPGHQPPPQRCDAAVPQGAWLIEHPRAARGRVRVTAYDWDRYAPPPPPPPPTVVYREVVVPPPPPPPVLVLPPVLAVGEFEIANGVLVRVEVR